MATIPNKVFQGDCDFSKIYFDSEDKIVEFEFSSEVESNVDSEAGSNER